MPQPAGPFWSCETPLAMRPKAGCLLCLLSSLTVLNSDTCQHTHSCNLILKKLYYTGSIMFPNYIIFLHFTKRLKNLLLTYMPLIKLSFCYRTPGSNNSMLQCSDDPLSPNMTTAYCSRKGNLLHVRPTNHVALTSCFQILLKN